MDGWSITELFYTQSEGLLPLFHSWNEMPRERRRAAITSVSILILLFFLCIGLMTMGFTSYKGGVSGDDLNQPKPSTTPVDNPQLQVPLFGPNATHNSTELSYMDFMSPIHMIPISNIPKRSSSSSQGITATTTQVVLALASVLAWMYWVG